MEYEVFVAVQNKGMRDYCKGFMVEANTPEEAGKQGIDLMREYASKNKKRKIDPTFWVCYVSLDGVLVIDNRKL